MKESVVILKLTNGECIIGKILETYDISNDSQKTIHISFPLKLVLVPKKTETGFIEALSLSPWIHPLTDDEFIDINSRNIVMLVSASIELSNYYKHCVNQFNISDGPDFDEAIEPTDKELYEIEEEIEEEVEIDKLNDLLQHIKSNVTIH
jgi:hypothetical protein|tara:strand:- start:8391 stop:8840 length:450 start_codon:yes stop_codon:yes gene_type:complete